jgi:hypothetical protein
MKQPFAVFGGNFLTFHWQQFPPPSFFWQLRLNLTKETMADSILAKGQESHLNSLSEDESSRYLQTEERDEVKEVQKIGRADTDRVRTWRFIVRAATLMTSLAVTLTTFSFLKLEDDNDFKTAVS